MAIPAESGPRTTIPSTISYMREPSCGTSDSSRRWIPAIPHMDRPPFKFYDVVRFWILSRISCSHFLGGECFGIIQHSCRLRHNPKYQPHDDSQDYRDDNGANHGDGLGTAGKAQHNRG